MDRGNLIHEVLVGPTTLGTASLKWTSVHLTTYSISFFLSCADSCKIPRIRIHAEAVGRGGVYRSTPPAERTPQDDGRLRRCPRNASRCPSTPRLRAVLSGYFPTRRGDSNGSGCDDATPFHSAPSHAHAQATCASALSRPVETRPPSRGKPRHTPRSGPRALNLRQDRLGCPE